MKRMTRGWMAVALAGAISLAPAAGVVNQPFVTTVYAHGHHGGGGYYGGHHGGGYNGGGVCYYYCGGHAAHLHNNGVCPYTVTAPSPSYTSARQTVSKATVKKVQRKLNKLGYKCGKADGIMGVKTKRAVKKFKIEHGLRADSTIKKPVLRALGLLKKK